MTTLPAQNPSATLSAAGPADRSGLAWFLSPRGELVAAIVAGALLFLAVISGGSELAGAFTWASLAIGLFHGGRAAAEAIRKGTFDIDVLMVVGALVAAGMGHPAEGALLLFLFVLAGALEALAMERTTRAVKALHALMPTRAVKWFEDATTVEGGAWREVAPESLAAGDLLKIMPGESVPTDASLVEGVSSINQASLTGESTPRTVRPGDALYAGTINIGNPIRATVTRPARESSLQRILDLVTTAQQQREPVQRFIDRLSQPYAIGVMAVSIVVFVVWWLILGRSVSQAAFTAMTLLIVASPCAVIIATPTATLAGIARGARAGVLFKGGQSVERLARLAAVAFDKTGTLTIGRPRVLALHPVGWSSESALLQAASGLEQDSTHPIAVAVRDAARERSLAPSPVTNPGFTIGRGVSGDIDGKPARLGNIAHTEELIPVCLRARVREVLASVQQRGQIGAVITWNDQAGVIILADTPRPGAEKLVRELHHIGVRPVVMLTGDNKATAEAIASSLGLDRFHAELLPADKVAHVAQLKSEAHARAHRAVGVIGDGVNDAPALAAADVSIAIGSIGSDAALESADIVLLADDLGVIPWAVRLARRTRRTIQLNLVCALGAILVLAALTLAGSYLHRPLPLWAGVLGHEGGTLLVVLNSLLLLVFQSTDVKGLAPDEPPAAAVGG